MYDNDESISFTTAMRDLHDFDIEKKIKKYTRRRLHKKVKRLEKVIDRLSVRQINYINQISKYINKKGSK